VFSRPKEHVILLKFVFQREPGRASAFALVLVLLALARGASAESRVPFLSEQLKNASDFRVRTQAALALGASDDPSAVDPLCRGLDDANDTVRSAAAAALGKLKNPSGLSCLKAHAQDRSASVRSVIDRSALVLASAGKPSQPPPPGPNDTFYVAIGPVTDKTGRSDKSVSDLVASSMQDKLLSLRGYAVAPQGEAAPAAKRIVQQKKLKGYFLQTRVEPPRAAGSDLTVEVRVTMWTYPAKALQGEFSPKLTMSGSSPGDRSSEDNLIKMAVERAIDSFARVTAASR
jgi:hypothetical protein